MPTHHCKHSAASRIFLLMLCLFACNAMAQQTRQVTRETPEGRAIFRILRQSDALRKEVAKRPGLLKSVQSRFQKLSKKPPKLVGGCNQITSGYFVMEDGSRSFIYREDGTGTLFLWRINSENKMEVGVRPILWWDVKQDSRMLLEYDFYSRMILSESEEELLSTIVTQPPGTQTATCGYDGDRLVFDGERVYVRMPGPNPYL